MLARSTSTIRKFKILSKVDSPSPSSIQNVTVDHTPPLYPPTNHLSPVLCGYLHRQNTLSAVVSKQQSLSGEIFSLTNSTFNLRSPSQLSSALFPNSPKQPVTMEKIDSLAGAGNPLAGKIFQVEAVGAASQEAQIVLTAVER
ncbi:hypothetical protein ScalyP_jg10154 [Parmales sp. scaly parma]|nr:hypothetical protein ScalyP_jg10154 [Parmales sp. scaly parma]